jgi:hypothetical protein
MTQPSPTSSDQPTTEKLLISSIHIPAPADESDSAPEMAGSVRTWIVPITDDGYFALTRETEEKVTAWDSTTSPEPVEYDSRLLDVTATGKVTILSDRYRDVEISFTATHQTRGICPDSGQEEAVSRTLSIDVVTRCLASIPFGLHESPRSNTNAVRHLLIMEVP